MTCSGSLRGSDCDCSHAATSRSVAAGRYCRARCWLSVRFDATAKSQARKFSIRWPLRIATYNFRKASCARSCASAGFVPKAIRYRYIASRFSLYARPTISRAATTSSSSTAQVGCAMAVSAIDSRARTRSGYPRPSPRRLARRPQEANLNASYSNDTRGKWFYDSEAIWMLQGPHPHAFRPLIPESQFTRRLASRRQRIRCGTE